MGSSAHLLEPDLKQGLGVCETSRPFDGSTIAWAERETLRQIVRHTIGRRWPTRRSS